jgi:hypothetical protein
MAIGAGGPQGDHGSVDCHSASWAGACHRQDMVPHNWQPEKPDPEGFEECGPAGGCGFCF